MRFTVGFSVRYIAAALSFSMWTSQVYAAGVPQEPASAQSTAPGPTGQLTVAAGTTVPLTLVTQIKAKSTPIGGTVRASVAFPVTVGTRLAIPAGVFVEGQLVQAVFPKGYKQPKHQAPVSPLKIHFTRLIYPNGYTVSLDAGLSSLLTPKRWARRQQQSKTPCWTCRPQEGRGPM